MSLTAKEIMSGDVIAVTPATPLKEFARLCAEDNISGAPVVRIDGTLVGVVSRTDLVRRMLEDDTRFGANEQRSFELDERQVADIMNPDVLTVDEDTPVSSIANDMARQRVHRVIVMDNGRVVGVVTSLDVLGSYAPAR